MAPPLASALEAARDQGRAPVIAEIKCRSPKEGDLLVGRDPLQLAAAMERAGAAGISVVTEPRHFGGSLDLLRDVASTVNIPVLRKDFIQSPGELHATLAAGASCLLLMVCMLDWTRLKSLRDEARQCGLETLIEVRDANELRQALTLDPDLLGINNRNIRELERDDGTIARSLDLLRQVPPGIRTLSESAISTPDDVTAVLQAGALGVLVGTSILRATDPEDAVRRLTSAPGGMTHGAG